MSTYHLIASVDQRPDEVVIRSVDTPNWGDDPDDVELAVFEIGAAVSTDVSDTAVSGSAAVDGNIITAPAVQALEDGKRYHAVLSFAIGSNLLQAYWEIRCSDSRPPDAA